MEHMKTVTAVITIRIFDDQPVCDWLPDVIENELEEGEWIDYYTDDEPVVLEKLLETVEE